MTPPTPPAMDELQPYILYRLDTAGQFECAVWEIKDGPKALALFLTDEKAVNYRTAGQLDAQWQVFRPQRAALLELLKACYQADVKYAVLDPTPEKAKRVFSIGDILAAVGQ
jgi:hypothetical protein